MPDIFSNVWATVVRYSNLFPLYAFGYLCNQIIAVIEYFYQEKKTTEKLLLTMSWPEILFVTNFID